MFIANVIFFFPFFYPFITNYYNYLLLHLAKIVFMILQYLFLRKYKANISMTQVTYKTFLAKEIL